MHSQDLPKESVGGGLQTPGGVPSAQEREPVPGHNGWIEPLVAPARPAGRQVMPLCNVHRGEPVARVHAPEAGTDGVSADGSVIPAGPGTEAPLVPGPGVERSPADPSLFLAARNGHAVVEENGTVDVWETVVVSHDMDYTTGDLVFVGSAVVHGDVKSELHITVGGDLEIMGDVGDVVIEAGGDVRIAKGFLGRGTGRITARGSVAVGHILNQSITAGRDVRIERESVNGMVRAGKSILAPSAVIMGGILEAEELIDAGSLGRSQGSQAKVRIGGRGKLNERLNVIEKEQRQAEKNLRDVKEAIYRLVRLKIDTGSLPADREQTLARLQEAQRLLPGALEVLRKETAALDAALLQTANAKLKVHETVHENVFIEINGARKLTDAAVAGVIFSESEGQIAAAGL